MIVDEDSARAFVAQTTDLAGLKRLDMLAELLRRENETQNLVAQASLDHLWVRHIADSAQLEAHVPRETPRWLDMGSGAGFPGIVLAILLPESQFELVESRRLRVEWLRSLISALGLSNCHVHGSGVGDIDPFEAHAITARAFAPLPKLLTLAARFSTTGTRWVLPKGRSAAQEVADLPKKRRTMFHVKPSLTDPEAGIILGQGRVEARS